jgi:L-lysine 6-transaminase
MAGRRVDEVPENVFAVSSRINSTWGGSLVDMVRSRRMLEVMEEERLFERAARLGKSLLTGLVDVEARHPALVSNARGRGLLTAFDLPDAARRDEVVRRARDEEHLLVLPCGPATVRLRPALSIEEAEIGRALEALDAVLDRVDAEVGQ